MFFMKISFSNSRSALCVPAFSTNFAAVMLVKTEAIVLRAFKLGENKLVVDLFTRSDGRVSVVVPMAKSGRGRLKKQLFQPLSLLAVTIDLRPKSSLQKLADAFMTVPYSSLPFLPGKLAISLFVAEFLCYALRGEQRNEPLFLYVVDSLRWLDGCGGDGYSNFHLVFLMRLSRFLGFYPNLDGYSDGCCFDLRTGCFCDRQPLHADYLATDEASLLGLMMRMDYPTMHLFRMSRADRNRLLDIAVRYYAIHIPDFPCLKSIAVLRDLFD